MEIGYFGTDLNDYGHFRFLLDDIRMLKVYSVFNDLPFHPEHLTNNLPKGNLIYYNGGGFSVIAIAGSPKDSRPGTKSVFWVRDNLTKEAMITVLKNNKIAMRLINAMPFDVAIKTQSLPIHPNEVTNTKSEKSDNDAKDNGFPST